MGRVTVSIKVENLADAMLAEQNRLASEEIRSAAIEALVDTGATLLCLPYKAIAELGLSLLGQREAKTANGVVTRGVYQGARLSILGRTCTVDVMELPEGTPALVGYIPLENLDLQPDPKQQCVIPNPEHGGKMVMDLYLRDALEDCDDFI